MQLPFPPVSKDATFCQTEVNIGASGRNKNVGANGDDGSQEISYNNGLCDKQETSRTKTKADNRSVKKRMPATESFLRSQEGKVEVDIEGQNKKKSGLTELALRFRSQPNSKIKTMMQAS